MNNKPVKDISYFPGCSLITSARENNLSLISFCRNIGFNLKELDDWNCCGSSSAHSINSDLAFDLAARNLSLVQPGNSLLVACPSCLLRLRHAHIHLKNNEKARDRFEKTWKKPVDANLEIIHFFELLAGKDMRDFASEHGNRLKKLRFVPYYGCMLARPPEMRNEKNYHGLMEKALSVLGAEPLRWAYISRCCGTFLSVVRPDVVTPMVNEIVSGAADAGADCIVTACAMCHMNLEVRCSLKQKVPVLHFSEILSLSLGAEDYSNWFSRHLVDPRPVLKAKEII